MSATEPANRVAVERFYEAVNEVIATGEVAPLSIALSPDYVELDDVGALVPGRAALERALLALHATAPALHLDIAELAGNGDRLIAIVQPQGVERATAFGLTLGHHIWWSPVEVFRVSAGLVVERVAVGERPARLEPLVRVPIELPAPATRVVSLVRVTIAPGGWRRAAVADGLHELVVEAGTIELAHTAGAVRTLPTGTGATGLGPGESLTLPSDADGATYEVRNTGQEPAILLEVLASASTGFPGGASPTGQGTDVTILAGGQQVVVPEGSAELVVGRVSIPTGGRLAWTAPAGPVLLWLATGTVELAADEAAFAWVRRQTDGTSRSAPLASLSTGDGAMLVAGTTPRFKTPGSVRSNSSW
jgi:hypothetical protein